MNAVPGCFPTYCGLFGSDESKMLLSLFGVHAVCVNSGDDSSSHIAMPNQNAGWSWKLNVPPLPSVVGSVGGERRPAVSCLACTHVASRYRHLHAAESARVPYDSRRLHEETSMLIVGYRRGSGLTRKIGGGAPARPDYPRRMPAPPALL